jgi:hypothetical protein
MKPEVDLDTLKVDFDNKAKSENQQMLYREREVDSLQQLIYGPSDEKNVDFPSETAFDTNRYDVAALKLEIFKKPSLKRQLKSKFVTG